MSLYDGPRDVSKHVAELEARWGGATRDHLNGTLCGWRAERHLAEVREGEQENRGRAKPGLLQRSLARSRAMLRAFGRSIELNRLKNT